MLWCIITTLNADLCVVGAKRFFDQLYFTYRAAKDGENRFIVLLVPPICQWFRVTIGD